MVFRNLTNLFLFLLRFAGAHPPSLPVGSFGRLRFLSFSVLNVTDLTDRREGVFVLVVRKKNPNDQPAEGWDKHVFSFERERKDPNEQILPERRQTDGFLLSVSVHPSVSLEVFVG